jgi:hypothetical protein
MSNKRDVSHQTFREVRKGPLCRAATLVQPPPRELSEALAAGTFLAALTT